MDLTDEQVDEILVGLGDVGFMLPFQTPTTVGSGTSSSIDDVTWEANRNALRIAIRDVEL